MAHNPTEHVQEELHHHAAHAHDEGHGHGHGGGGKWITAAATTAAILAALAAAAGALATRHLTQSMLIRIRANDDWNYYQAKSIKSSLLDAKIYNAQLSKAEPRKSDLEKKDQYAKDMPEIQASARGFEKLSKEHLETHETFEGAATMFHIAIAVVAIAVVARKKGFWMLSMAGGAVGLFFFAKAFLHAPPAMEEKEEPAGQVEPGKTGEHKSGGEKGGHSPEKKGEEHKAPAGDAAKGSGGEAKANESEATH
jgi:Domain of unknown function (DUF4337)